MRSMRVVPAGKEWLARPPKVRACESSTPQLTAKHRAAVNPRAKFVAVPIAWGPTERNANSASPVQRSTSRMRSRACSYEKGPLRGDLIQHKHNWH
jgi:hypothetical protein